MPVNVRRLAYLSLLLSLAAATAITATQAIPELDLTIVGVLVALTVALVVAASLPSKPIPTSDFSVTLDDAVLLAMLVAVPVGILPWLVLLGVTFNEVARKRPLTKMAFNVGTSGLGASAAVMTVVVVSGAVDTDTLAAKLGVAALAVVVDATVQLILLASLQHQLSGKPFREHLALDGFLDMALALNILLGLVIAAAIVADPWMSVVAIGIIAVLGNVLRQRDTQKPAA